MRRHRRGERLCESGKRGKHDPVLDSIKNGQQRLELVQQFVEKVEDSIQANTFVSLILRGVKQNKSSKGNTDENEESLRGSIRQVQGRLIRLPVKNKSDKSEDETSLLLQLTFKFHQATDICKNIHVEEISSTLSNLILDPVASEWGVQAVRSHPIQGAELQTTNDGKWEMRIDNKLDLRRKIVNNKEATNLVSSVPSSHDRHKKVPISNEADFLLRLGVTNQDGKPRPAMKSKVCSSSLHINILALLD
jgi:hypothetical protein